LSSGSGAPTGLSKVRWTRTTVGGPNYLGGSVTMSALYNLQALQSDTMAHLTNIAQTTNITLDSREDFVVDLSSELVEKDLQVEQLSQRIATLEQHVEIWDNTIDILEIQLHDVQEELEEANNHLEMHH
jgi:chromosome segregation ATPase